MNKKIFWIGVIILVVGVIMFSYAYSTIQSLMARFPIQLDYNIRFYPDLQQQWNLAQILQPLGIGILILGIIVIAYSLRVKK